jgi:hypothetical protein
MTQGFINIINLLSINQPRTLAYQYYRSIINQSTTNSGLSILSIYYQSINHELWLIDRHKLIVEHVLIVQGVECRAEHLILIAQAGNLFFKNFIAKVPTQTFIQQVAQL